MITEQQTILGWQLHYPDCPNSSSGLCWAFKLGYKLPCKAYFYNNYFQTVLRFKKIQAGPVKQTKKGFEIQHRLNWFSGIGLRSRAGLLHSHLLLSGETMGGCTWSKRPSFVMDRKYWSVTFRMNELDLRGTYRLTWNPDGGQTQKRTSSLGKCSQRNYCLLVLSFVMFLFFMTQALAIN